MSLNSIVVSTPLPTTSLPAGQPVASIGGRLGETIMAELHGKYYELCKNGSLFYAAQPAAGVIALPTGGATASYALFNPSNSTVDVVPIFSLILETVVAGTPVLGGLCWSLSPSSSTATTGTAIASQCTKLAASGPASAGKALTTATLPITPTVFLPVVQKWTGAITTAPRAATFKFDFDGTVILPPGAAMGLQQEAADTTNITVQVGVLWAEVPV